MELQAVLEALRVLEGEVEVSSDSTYVVNCFKDRWFEGWLKRGWRNANKKPVANRDLWEPLIELYLERQHELSFVWVKGHAGIGLNDRADELAVVAAAKFKESVAAAAKVSAERAHSEVIPEWPISNAIWVVGATELDDDQSIAVSHMVAGLDPTKDVLVSGIRRGAELSAAEGALTHGVRLAVVLPFEDPAGSWDDEHKARFDSVLGRAEWVVTLPGDRGQPGQAVAARNEWLEGQVAGAFVVGDPALAAALDEAGLTVILDC